MRWTPLVTRAIEILSQLDVNNFTDGGETTYRLLEIINRSINSEVTADVGRASCLEQHAFMSIENMKQVCVEREIDSNAGNQQAIKEFHSYLPLRVGICNWCEKEDPGKNAQLVMDAKSVALLKKSVDAMCAVQHSLTAELADG